MSQNGKLGPAERRLARQALIRGTIASVFFGFAFGSVCYAISNTEASYGLWLFILVPILMGVGGSVVANFAELRPVSVGYNASFWSYLIVTTVLLGLRVEGAICLVMAVPLYFPLYWAGYFMARMSIDNWHDRGRGAMVSLVPILGVAALTTARVAPAAGVRTQTTTLEIDAPPERIWPLLFEMSEIPPAEALPFRMGVAHPVAITSAGRSVGSARECRLSTGVMPERISISEQDRRLRFEVLETPPSMKEWNPFGAVDAPHLRGHFTVQRGEFRLTPLPGGRTRLEGSSTYTLRIYPVAYWDLWADRVVDEIHLTVMKEIARRTEGGTSVR